MAKKREKVYMPSGVGGLIRYPEEEEEVLKIKPKHLIYIIIGIVIFELLVRLL